MYNVQQAWCQLSQPYNAMQYVGGQKWTPPTWAIIVFSYNYDLCFDTFYPHSSLWMTDHFKKKKQV